MTTAEATTLAATAVMPEIAKEPPPICPKCQQPKSLVYSGHGSSRFYKCKSCTNRREREVRHARQAREKADQVCPSCGAERKWEPPNASNGLSGRWECPACKERHRVAREADRAHAAKAKKFDPPPPCAHNPRAGPCASCREALASYELVVAAHNAVRDYRRARHNIQTTPRVVEEEHSRSVHDQIAQAAANEKMRLDDKQSGKSVQ
jgi:transposase-like protein